MPTVFIVYSAEDYAVAERLAHFLIGEGFIIWWDQADLMAQHEWSDKLDATLKQSSVVLVLCSNAAKASSWVLYLWTMASALEIPLIRVMLEPDMIFDSVHKKLETYPRQNCLGAYPPCLYALSDTLKQYMK